MGITWWQFWELNPHKIKIISKGYHEKQVEMDSMMYAWWGNYGLSAVSVAIDHCFNGRKANSKFVDKPLMQVEVKNDEKSMSQKELEKNAENVFLQLGIMGANFNRQKKQESMV
jgi:hypothetical protein